MAKKQKPFSVLLVGPEGVGKTSLIAALARHGQLREPAQLIQWTEGREFITDAMKALEVGRVGKTNTAYRVVGQFQGQGAPTRPLALQDDQGEAWREFVSKGEPGEPSDAARPTWRERSLAADALFVVLDHTVANTSTGGAVNYTNFAADLQSWLASQDRKLPIFLILTKWDLNEGEQRHTQGSSSARAALVDGRWAGVLECFRSVASDGHVEVVTVGLPMLRPGFSGGESALVEALRDEVGLKKLFDWIFNQVERTSEVKHSKSIWIPAALLLLSGVFVVLWWKDTKPVAKKHDFTEQASVHIAVDRKVEQSDPIPKTDCQQLVGQVATNEVMKIEDPQHDWHRIGEVIRDYRVAADRHKACSHEVLQAMKLDVESLRRKASCGPSSSTADSTNALRCLRGMQAGLERLGCPEQACQALAEQLREGVKREASTILLAQAREVKRHGEACENLQAGVRTGIAESCLDPFRSWLLRSDWQVALEVCPPQETLASLQAEWKQSAESLASAIHIVEPGTKTYILKDFRVDGFNKARDEWQAFIQTDSLDEDDEPHKSARLREVEEDELSHTYSRVPLEWDAGQMIALGVYDLDFANETLAYRVLDGPIAIAAFGGSRSWRLKPKDDEKHLRISVASVGSTTDASLEDAVRGLQALPFDAVERSTEDDKTDWWRWRASLKSAAELCTHHGVPGASE